MKAMKNVFGLACSLALGFMACNASAFEAKEGSIEVKDLGGVTMHVYTTKAGNTAEIMETGKLVIFDVPASDAGNKEFKAYADSLGKPVDRLIISHIDDHHWLGINDTFPGVPVYSADADAINQKGQEMVEAAKGKGMALSSAPKAEKIADGAVTLDGVEYLFTSYPALAAFTIELPAQKTVIVHHLGYKGVHVPMAPFADRLAILQSLKDKGMQLFVGGHGEMGDASFVDSVAQYYDAVAKTVAESANVEEAKARLISLYPNYKSAFLLDYMLPGLMKK